MFLTAQMEGPWVACAAVHVVWQVVCAAPDGVKEVGMLSHFCVPF